MPKLRLGPGSQGSHCHSSVLKHGIPDSKCLSHLCWFASVFLCTSGVSGRATVRQAPSSGIWIFFCCCFLEHQRDLHRVGPQCLASCPFPFTVFVFAFLVLSSIPLHVLPSFYKLPLSHSALRLLPCLLFFPLSLMSPSPNPAVSFLSSTLAFYPRKLRSFCCLTHVSWDTSRVQKAGPALSPSVPRILRNRSHL